MRVLFKDTHFAFEFVRNLGFAYYGGSDLGEMVATAGSIEEGNFESWFARWDERARRILGRADASFEHGHKISAREAYLRASTYFRMAEFYLHGNPSDPRILSEARESQRAYDKGADLMGSTWERVEIPYEGTTLPGYLYKVDDSGKRRPTVLFHGGFDSSLEELFYYFAAPAIRRGYNCLAFDGPGQGMPIREQKLTFRPDWEKVVTPAVDYALTRPEIDANRLVQVGMSLGGYFAARAAAFEHRFAASIFFDGVYSLHESIRKMLPADAMAAFNAGDDDEGQRIIDANMPGNTPLRWLVEQGTWSLGASNVAQLIEMSKAYSLEGCAQLITCPCLVMKADADIFFSGQPEQVYDALVCPKTLAEFTAEDGAENHCQSGALAYKDQVVFDWIDQTLGL